MARNAKAIIVETLDYSTPGPAGAVQFTCGPSGKKSGWIHNCPCGCGILSFMGFDPEMNVPAATWQVTAGSLDDLDSLTLAPSIGIKGPEGQQYHWHGYLERGVFVER